MKDLFDLKDKIALITGASSGLGKRFSYVLAKAGAKVILAARRLDMLEKFADDLKNEGCNASVLKMDVADKNSIESAFQNLETIGNTIDICVNNAGVARRTHIFEENHDHFEHIFQTNVIGLWHVTREAAKLMKKYDTHGNIINIASIGGTNYSRIGLTGYCASKAAVIQMTKCLVGELAEAHIRINAILPGTIVTPMTEHRVGTEENRKHVASGIPLGFVPEPDALDGALLYLASNKASPYTTGSCLTVDGGVTWGGELSHSL